MVSNNTGHSMDLDVGLLLKFSLWRDWLHRCSEITDLINTVLVMGNNAPGVIIVVFCIGRLRNADVFIVNRAMT